MATKKRSPLDRYSACPDYIITRGRAFDLPIEELGFTVESDSEVYGAVIDMPMGPDLLGTLVCFVNGAANLYFNKGGGVIGAAKRYRATAFAARGFVISATSALGECTKTRTFDLPIGQTHFVYLLTKGGVYKMEILPSNLDNESVLKRNVFNYYQNVMGQIRNAQIRDQATRQD